MKVRVIQYGLGAMGGGMLRMMAGKENIEIVAAISASSSKSGMDAGRAVGLARDLGIIVSGGVSEAITKEADVVLHATCSEMSQVTEEIVPILRSRKNVITIAEEALFPLARNKKYFEEIDKVAKEYGVTVLGTGINPGFMMDVLPISATSIMLSLKSVKLRRVVNFGRYGKTVWEHIGVGKDIEAFNQGISDGSIVLHVGLEQTVGITASSLGWKLDRVSEEKESIVSKIRRETDFGPILPGEVCGFRQIAVGWKGDQALITQEIVGLVGPDEKEDGMAVGNEYWLEGDPSVHLFVGGEFADQGGKGTIARAVNSIPQVMNARPGFLSVVDLPPSPCLKDRD